jgi:hypothetical protein
MTLLKRMMGAVVVNQPIPSHWELCFLEILIAYGFSHRCQQLEQILVFQGNSFYARSLDQIQHFIDELELEHVSQSDEWCLTVLS